MPPKPKAAPAPVKGKSNVPAKTASNVPAVAKAKTTALTEGLEQNFLDELAAEAGAGLQNATAQDFAIPFYYLLQKMSPQVDPDSPKYVEGAKPGMFINSVTNELFDSLDVIHVEFQKVFIEWIPRDAGGGFIQSYDSKREADTNCEEGHQIVDTANHFVLVRQSDDSWAQGILSLTSTKLKASRSWLSKMSLVTIPIAGGGKKIAPTYARFYTIEKEGPITNTKGTYFTIAVNPVEGNDGWVQDANLREQAKDFAASLMAGTKGVDYNAGVVDAEVIEDDQGM